MHPGADRAVRGRAGARPRRVPDQGLRRRRHRDGEGMGLLSAVQPRSATERPGRGPRPRRHPPPGQAGRGLRAGRGSPCCSSRWPSTTRRSPTSSASGSPATTPANEINGQAVVWVVAWSLALVRAGPRGGQQGAQGRAGACSSTSLVGLAFFTGFIIWYYADQDLARPLAIVNPLPGTVRLATPLVFGALAGLPVRAVGRHQHRDRGPVPDGRVLRRGGLQPALQRRDGPARRHPGRRRDGRAAGRVRAALPGQPGGARRRADRPGDRPDRASCSARSPTTPTSRTTSTSR